MNNVIVYTRPDGGVSIVHPARGARLVRRISVPEFPEIIFELDPPKRLEEAFAIVGLGRGWTAEKQALVTIIYGETEAEFIGRIQTKDVPAEAIDVTVVEETTLSSDRTFRDAWKNSGGVISVDMPKARDIHVEKIAAGQTGEIARLKIEERKERLKGNTAQADSHAATVTALEALDLNVLATQIAAAPNPTALKVSGR